MKGWQLNNLATRIAQEILERAEYSDVYKDEEASELSEEEMKKIHRLIQQARVEIY